MAWNEPSLWEKPRRDPVQPNWEGETSTFTLALPQALPPGQETPERKKPKLSVKESWNREQENDVNKILEWKADRWDFSFLPTVECSGRERSKLSGDSILANGASSISKIGARGGRNQAGGMKVLWKDIPLLYHEKRAAPSSVPLPCPILATRWRHRRLP